MPLLITVRKLGEAGLQRVGRERSPTDRRSSKVIGGGFGYHDDFQNRDIEVFAEASAPQKRWRCPCSRRPPDREVGSRQTGAGDLAQELTEERCAKFASVAGVVCKPVFCMLSFAPGFGDLLRCYSMTDDMTHHMLTSSLIAASCRLF